MFPGYVKMGGPFGGVIVTSEGFQAVAPDGTFWVPQGDVPAMLRRGAFFSTPGLASVRIGGYVIYEDNTSDNLEIQTPDGTIVPFVVDDAINAPGETYIALGSLPSYTLANGSIEGQRVGIKDNAGTAQVVQPIIYGRFDGGATEFLGFNQNFAAFEFVWNGTQWSVF